MKKWSKLVIGIVIAACAAFALISFSCSKMKVSGSAETTFSDGSMDTAYAESPQNAATKSVNLMSLSTKRFARHSLLVSK